MNKEWNAEMAKTVDLMEENKQSKELFNEGGFQYKEKAKFKTNHMLIDNSNKLVLDYDKKEFDELMDDLGKKNGYTLY